MADEIAEDIPDTILNSFVHTQVKGGKKTFMVQSVQGEFYEKKKETFFTGVQFREFGSEGGVITEGTCEYARLYTDTDNVELWGGLRFYSAREEAQLTAEALFWNDAEGTLTAAPEALVEIEKDSGSLLRGRGFSAETGSRTVRFGGGVSGTWVGTDED